MFKRLVVLACVALVLVAIHAISLHEHVAEFTKAHIYEVDRHLTYGELLHYALLLFLGLPAAVVLTSAWSESFWQRVASWMEKTGYWLPALCAAAASFCISRFVTRQAWFTDDEQAYLFQMDMYRHFELKVPALQPEWLFHHPFTVVRAIDGVQYWFGLYGVMQPALMAVSSLFGSPLVSQWLCAGGIAYQTGRLAERLTGHRPLGVLAAWLCATSPMLIGLSATYHTSVLACFLSVSTLYALVKALDNPTFARGALAGVLGGATFLTRGSEGTLMILGAGVALLCLLARDWRRAWPAAAGFGVAGALVFAVYVRINLSTTGEPLKQAYTLWGEQVGRFIGFGTVGLSWGRIHTPLHALGQTFTSLVRMNTWLFGWPISLFAALASLTLWPREKAVIGLVALSVAHLAFYSLINFGSVHDFGSAYHVWHVPWFAALTAYTLRGIAPVSRYGARMALSMTLVALSAFWPLQVKRWREVGAEVRAPVDAVAAATRGRPSIVLYSAMKPATFHSWVGCSPTSYPRSSLWWARDAPGAEQQLRVMYPDRVLLRLAWAGEQPVVSEL